jgi:DNA-binding NarL/FixJ family response regulator
MSVTEEQRVRVLVVDDHPMVREGLRSMLSTAPDLEVVGEAGTAHEAIVQARALQPDVILLDIQLPDMDGVTVLPQLKTVASAAQVLIVTMHEDAAYILQAVTAGAAGYIVKGVRRYELLAAIRTAVAGSSVSVPLLLGQGQQRVVPTPTRSPGGSVIRLSVCKCAGV